MRRFSARLGVAVALGVWLVITAGSVAGAADVPDIVSGDLSVAPKGGDAVLLIHADKTYGPAVAHVVLRNPAAAPANVTLTAVLDDGTPLTLTGITGAGITAAGNAFALPATSIVPVTFSIEHIARTGSTHGRLILAGAGSPESVVLTIERPTPPWYLWGPIGLGGVLALIIVGLGALAKRDAKAQLPAEVKGTLALDSGWASNLVVVGAVVTAVLGAASSLGDDAFGDFALSRFVALNLVLVGLVTVAPLVYAALGHDDTKGSVVGYIASCGLILAAALAQLGGLAVLVGAAPRTGSVAVGLWILLGVVGLLVIVYSWREIDRVLQPPASGTEHFDWTSVDLEQHGVTTENFRAADLTRVPHVRRLITTRLSPSEERVPQRLL